MQLSRGLQSDEQRVCSCVCSCAYELSDNHVAKVIEDIDIESEDPTSPESESEDDDEMEPPSRSTGTPSAGPTGPKAMTTRQAVLAAVVDPSHVSLSMFLITVLCSNFHVF